MSKTTNRKNLLILSLTLVIVMLGFGMVIPILPFYVAAFGAGGGAMGLLVATAALTEFLFGPVWGGISDRTGRKPILMIGVLGYGLSLLLFGLSTELWMLFASRALSGVLSSAALSTAMAYIGDSTADEERGGGMGALGAAAGLGTILGPGLGGWLAGGSLSTPFFTGAAMSLVALLLVAWLLPETLPREARAQAAGRLAPANVRGLWQALSGPIGSLLALAFLATVGTSHFESVFGLYALKKFSYGPEKVGALLMVLGVVTLFARGVLTGFVTRRWGEPAVIKAALLAGALCFVFLRLAESDPAVMLATGLFVLITAFLRPAIHALVSKRTTMGQGAAMGLSNSCVSLGRVAGPLMAGALFDANLEAPYLAGAVILGCVFALSWIWLGAARPGVPLAPASR